MDEVVFGACLLPDMRKRTTVWTIQADGAGMRLDAWLAGRPEVGSRAKARLWIEQGKVFLGDREAGLGDAARRLAAGDRVELWVDRPGSADVRRRGVHQARAGLRVVFEDGALLVADKPPGILVEPLPGEEQGEITLLDLAADRFRFSPGVTVHVVHRIDRDTTGLVAFAKTEQAWRDLKRQFAKRGPERVYLAVVEGRLRLPSGEWRDRLVWDGRALRQRSAHPRERGGKESVARYRLVEQFDGAALLEVSLETGKRNQIRIQAALRQHPLLGERLYRFGDRRERRGRFDFPRQALHATRLVFAHPSTGRRVTFSSDLPDDLAGLLERLRRGGGT